jgi:uncharacterized protein YjbI with pentapeptide repeats
MKASQVLQQYKKKGRRDFKGVSLRGQSFVKQDLSGADFSQADIRGANFSHATLTGTNFAGATAGLQWFWVAVQWVLALLMSALSGILASYSGVFVVATSLSVESLLEKWVLSIFFAIVLIAIFGVIVCHGFTVQAVSLIAVAGAVAVAVAFAVAVGGAGAFAGAVTGAVSGAFALAGAFTFAGAGAVAGAGAGAGPRAGAGAVTVVVIVAVTVAGAVAGAVALAFAVAGAVSGAAILLSLYVAWRAMKGDEKFAIVRQFAIAFGSLGGTRFYCATLTDANFTAATLKNCNFRDATLTRTCWKDAEKLDHARPGTTYLNYPHIRELVTTREGEKGNFDRLNLRGVNLQGAKLAEASFILADLSDANLQDAILSHAKLVKTQLDRTDLTGATLTGAYIEDWGITTETRLDGIRCEYVYRRLPPNQCPPFLQLPPSQRLDQDPRREPKDQNKTFEDGDFSDFITPLKQTLDLYHNRPEDLRLVALAFQKLQDENPNAELELISLDKKGKNRDKLLLRAETAPNADQSSLHNRYFNNLNELKSLSPEELRTLLFEREGKLQLMEKLLQSRSQTSQVSITNINHQGDKNMSNRAINMGPGDYRETNVNDRATYVEGDYYNRSNPVETQQLLQILDRSYPPDLPADTQAEIDVAVKGIAKNPALKQRVIGALKSGGIEAVKEITDNSYVNILLAAYEGWQNPE